MREGKEISRRRLCIQIALQQIYGVSGLQMAEVIQNEIFVLLCDYRCKGGSN
jgi:hypothetical protein